MNSKKFKSIYKLHILLLICISQLNCYENTHQNTDFRTYSFKDYYWNKYHINNEIWQADSLYYANMPFKSLKAYEGIDTSILTQEQKTYIYNQRLIVSEEYKLNTIKKNSLKIQNDTCDILVLQVEYLNFLNEEYYLHKNSTVNPNKLENKLNHAYILKKIINLKKTSKNLVLSNSDYKNIIETDLIITSSKITNKDLYSYHNLLHQIYKYNLNNKQSKYYADLMIDEDNYDFNFNGYNKGISHYNKALIEAYNNYDNSIKHFKISIDQLRHFGSKYKTQEILHEAAISSYYFRIHNDNFLNDYKKLIKHDSIDYHSIDRIIANKHFYSSKYDSSEYYAKKALNHLIKGPKNSNTTEKLRYIISKSQINLKKYKEARQSIFTTLNLKYKNKTSKYSPDRFLLSREFQSDKFYHEYLYQIAQTYYKEYTKSRDPILLRNAYLFIKGIENYLYKSFSSIEEKDLLILFDIKDEIFDFALNLIYDLILLEPNNNEYKEYFFKISEFGKADLLSFNNFMNDSQNKYFQSYKSKIEEIIPNQSYNSERNYLQYSNGLISEYPKYFMKNSLTIPEIQLKCEEEKEALVVFNVVYSSIYIQLFSNDDYQLFRIAFNKENLKKFLTDIQDKDDISPKDFIASSHAVYKDLIQPWIGQNNSKDLIIIPDDYLNNVPFSALVKRNKIYSSFCNIPYFQDNYNISYANSVTTINFNQNKIKSKAPKIHGFSYSSREEILKNKSFSNDLSGAVKEIEYVQRRYPTAKVFFGIKASKEKFIKEYNIKSEILHIATHGMSNQNSINSNYLLFKASHLSVDTLHIHELNNLKNTLSLVMLSSCESSGGKLIDGEGKFSMSRSFISKGADNVISSMWNADDKSSFDFFTSLYDHNFQPTISQSVNTSIRTIKSDKQKNCHPYYWAGIQHFRG